MKSFRGVLYPLAVLLIAFCLYQLWDMSRSTEETENLYGSLAEQVHGQTTTQIHQFPVTTETQTQLQTAQNMPVYDDVTASTRPVIQNPWLAELQAEHEELTGWLTIPNTVIDYPVMQTAEDNDFYLTHDFNGNEERHGTPFLDVHCSVESSDNLIIYGHHMKDGTMFQNLMYYKDADFCQNNGSIQFSTAEQTRNYEVFCVMVISAEESEDFPYFSYPSFSDASAFSAYLDRCREFSVWNRPDFPVFGDKLLTLSTCEYSKADGRLVVLAKATS